MRISSGEASDAVPLATSRNVNASVPSNNEGIVSLRQIFFPSAELTLVARRAAFFAGDAPGPPDAPPHFADSNEEVTAGMASMDSPFELTQATFIEPFA